MLINEPLEIRFTSRTGAKFQLIASVGDNAIIGYRLWDIPRGTWSRAFPTSLYTPQPLPLPGKAVTGWQEEVIEFIKAIGVYTLDEIR